MLFLIVAPLPVGNIIHLLHDSEGDMKICSPKKNHIPRGQRPRGI
jgi:hypothetical protein